MSGIDYSPVWFAVRMAVLAFVLVVVHSADADIEAAVTTRDSIREAQESLAVLGYQPGPADGIWGQRSIEAYGGFLRDIGLPPSDQLTPQVLQAMRLLTSRVDEEISMVETNGGVEPGLIEPPREAIREAQELLTVLGYQPGPADGIWGRRSAEAILSFQRDAGLSPSNQLTPQALFTLRSVLQSDETGAPPETGLRSGQSEQPPPEAIREMQGLLTALGYQPGPPDGKWGSRTERAYNRFLRDAELPQTNSLSPENLRRLRAHASAELTGYGTPSSTQLEVGDLTSVLHRAVETGDQEILGPAIDSGSNINGLDSQGWTPLMHAVRAGNPEIVKTLLEAGANIEIRALDGSTPLIIGADLGRLEAVKLLMAAGADISALGPDGRSALEVARSRTGIAEVNHVLVSILEGRESSAEALENAIDAERLVRRWKDGMEFRDCETCPVMVVIPAGSFTMGEYHKYTEGPAHRVDISRPFAVAKHEVTLAEYTRFQDSTGYTMYRSSEDCYVGEGLGEVRSLVKHWQNPGFEQEPDHPVTCVDWFAAQAYAEWLSVKTGVRYRLLTEAEWEWAARAGTQSKHNGENHTNSRKESSQPCKYKNSPDRMLKRQLDDDYYRGGLVSCSDGFAFTSPVGTFPENAFGLQDMLGNVAEWVEDCWNDDYEGAPNDGSAWLKSERDWKTSNDDCRDIVVLGGSWDNNNTRWSKSEVSTDVEIGFRVARSFAP